MAENKIIDIESEEKKKIRALLIGAPHKNLKELEGLVDTLGMEVARSYNLTRLEVAPTYGMGKGKAEEISALAAEIDADVIIFDYELDPRKQRNWEKLAKRPVFDRHEVILRIFAQRAQTKEAVLQVQLARLEYSLPRLAHMYGDMARQRGGNYGSKGSGETQLELDQRHIRTKIQQLKKELEQVVLERETQRKRREKVPVPSCALAGYTNAGKSSLLNALTGADVFIEDKLFATLDPTTRKLQIKSTNQSSGTGASGTNILLTDTVGFISNLPHSLVNAFKSTLEEAQRANLILLVLDASDENVEQQYKTVVKVLEEIKADKTPKIIVLNKMDKIEGNTPLIAKLDELFPDNVKISAKTKLGFDELSEQICSALMGKERKYIIPTEQAQLLAEARKTGLILEESWLDDGIHVTIKTGGLRQNHRLSNLLLPYAEKETTAPEYDSKEFVTDEPEEKQTGFKKKFMADW